MNRARILELLDKLLLELAHDVPAPNITGEPPITAEEWMYVKGIASGELLRLRDRLEAADRLHAHSS